MKKIFIILAVVFVVLIGVLLWWFSDSQVIMRNTRALAESLTIAADESKSTRALKSQDFAALLATDFSGSVQVDHYDGQIRRDEAVSGHQYLALSSESSHATVVDIAITSLEDDRATVTAKFSILVNTKGGGSYSDSADATLRWVKTADEIWKLKSAELGQNSP